jgi:2-keto-3-deoxy-L-rhamnonate aldolase RhmA
MIATIKSPSKSSMKNGLWQAMMLGIEAEPYADNSFDIVVHDQTKADLIAKAAHGKIVAVTEKSPIFSY